MNPKILYKYRGENSRTVEIFQTEKIWAPTLESLNDPFDGNVILNENISEEECVAIVRLIGNEEGYSEEKIKAGIGKYIDEKGKFRSTALSDLHKDLPNPRDSIANIGVICLSERNDNTLMWSHYCSDHRGVCIGFDVSELFIKEPEACLKMNYQSDYPRATLADIFLTTEQYSIKTVWTKAIDWKYEDEWRYLVENGNSLVEIPGPIKEIVFGCNSNPEFENEIRDLTRGRGIVFKKARLSSTQYKLIVQ